MEMNIIATINRAIDPEVTTLIYKKQGFIFEVSPSEGELDYKGLKLSMDREPVKTEKFISETLYDAKRNRKY
jgi:hypothetical protein